MTPRIIRDGVATEMLRSLAELKTELIADKRSKKREEVYLKKLDISLAMINHLREELTTIEAQLDGVSADETKVVLRKQASSLREQICKHYETAIAA